MSNYCWITEGHGAIGTLCSYCDEALKAGDTAGFAHVYEDDLVVDTKFFHERCESNAQVVVESKGWTRGDLSEAFDRVANKENWKLAIDTTIECSADDHAIICEAVAFFTGSVANVTPVGEGAKRFHFKAAGYYSAIGS